MALSLLVFVVEVVHLASSLLSSVASSELVVSMLCMSVMFIPYDNVPRSPSNPLPATPDVRGNM